MQSLKSKIINIMAKYNRKIDDVELLQKRIKALEKLIKHREKMSDFIISLEISYGKNISLLIGDEEYEFEAIDSMEDLEPFEDFIHAYRKHLNAEIEEEIVFLTNYLEGKYDK